MKPENSVFNNVALGWVDKQVSELDIHQSVFDSDAPVIM